METIPPRQLPLQISPEEIEIINDIRGINFGKVTVVVQNGVIVSKEVTTITKNGKNKNSSNGGNGNNYRYDNYGRVKMEVMLFVIAAGAVDLIFSANKLSEIFF